MFCLKGLINLTRVQIQYSFGIYSFESIIHFIMVHAFVKFSKSSIPLTQEKGTLCSQYYSRRVVTHRPPSIRCIHLIPLAQSSMWMFCFLFFSKHNPHLGHNRLKDLYPRELHYQPWERHTRSYHKPPDLNFEALQTPLCGTDLVPIQVWQPLWHCSCQFSVCSQRTEHPAFKMHRLCYRERSSCACVLFLNCFIVV